MAVPFGGIETIMPQHQSRSWLTMNQRSPKFFLREKVISQVVNRDRLRKTWKKKTYTDFRNFPLVDPLDYMDVDIHIDDVCRRIVSKIGLGEYSVSGTKRFLIEKSKGLCRQMTIPSVHDALTLQCLADAFWGDIKSKSPSKNDSSSQKITHSQKMSIMNLLTDRSKPGSTFRRKYLVFQTRIITL